MEIYRLLKEKRAEWIYRRESIQKVKRNNNLPGNVRYFNYWGQQDFHHKWFSRFLKYHTNLNNEVSVAVFSVFGHRSALKYADGDIKIFYTGENVRNRHLQYADNMLGDKSINLSLGFDYFEDERYLRFPLWMQYMFEPDWSIAQIKDKISRLRNPYIESRKKFCSLIASHDFYGIREKIVSQINQIDYIHCAGKFKHNDDTLLNIYNDDKLHYLNQFIFNICPENTNSYGYVTEKIFECIESGCIPIYWGSYNDPEPEILNKDAILFFLPDSANKPLLSQIEFLYSHPKVMIEFMHQPRLRSSAEDCILSRFEQLSKKMNELISGR